MSAVATSGEKRRSKMGMLQSTPYVALVLVLASALAVLGSQRVAEDALEFPSRRSYFYAGGRYVEDGQGGHAFAEAMYVEHLTPPNGPSQKYPLVFVHGQGHTAAVSCIRSETLGTLSSLTSFRVGSTNQTEIPVGPHSSFGTGTNYIW